MKTQIKTQIRTIKKSMLTLTLGAGLVLVLLSSHFSQAADNTLLIDVRTQAEFSEGHLQDAVLIPYDEIAQQIASAAIDKNQPIQLYCRSGRRAEIALQTLSRLGYHNVRNLGGLDEVQASGLPLIVKTD